MDDARCGFAVGGLPKRGESWTSRRAEISTLGLFFRAPGGNTDRTKEIEFSAGSYPSFICVYPVNLWFDCSKLLLKRTVLGEMTSLLKGRAWRVLLPDRCGRRGECLDRVRHLNFTLKPAIIGKKTDK